MRHFLVSIVFIPVLLVGCMRPLPEETFLQPEKTGSGSTSSLEENANEKMPETTDSLEPEGTKLPVTISGITGGVLIGNTDAPVLTMYTDYGCEYCRRFSIRDLPVVQRTYVESNRLAVRLLFLPRSDAGTVMAKAAVCAAELGAFATADAAFGAETVASNVTLSVLAKKIGVDQKAFSTCMTDEKTSDDLSLTKKEAEAKGVTRVPSFRLNDESWLGLKEQDDLLRTLEKVLSR